MLEKTLHKIQSQIRDLAPTLELFVDESVQPSADDCANLQAQLHELGQQLAVYRFIKNEHELSPAFSIHAHVSQSLPDPLPPAPEREPDRPAAPPPPPDPPPAAAPVASSSGAEKKEADQGAPPLSISINDKFRFINELFSQNTAEYNVAVEQLNNLRTAGETELYLSSLKNLYGWRENSEVVRHFVSLAKRRFA